MRPASSFGRRVPLRSDLWSQCRRWGKGLAKGMTLHEQEIQFEPYLWVCLTPETLQLAGLQVLSEPFVLPIPSGVPPPAFKLSHGPGMHVQVGRLWFKHGFSNMPKVVIYSLREAHPDRTFRP
jgi:hypothetical protein